MLGISSNLPTKGWVFVLRAFFFQGPFSAAAAEKLQGRFAVVTGAGRGIGKATCPSLMKKHPLPLTGCLRKHGLL